jgi:uncharacterized membrane protein
MAESITAGGKKVAAGKVTGKAVSARSPDAAQPFDFVHEPLEVRTIGIRDLREALALGWSDFMAKPSHIIFLGLIYPIAGLLLAQASINSNLLPLIFPLLAGFALIGPFAGLGLYEISRRRELGLDTSWRHALDVFDARSIRSIVVLGAMLSALFLVWLWAAMAIYSWAFRGDDPASISAFVTNVTTTWDGVRLIVVGHAVGLVFAIVALMLSAVSFPLLLDKHTDLGVAIATSTRAVLKNPVTMAIWGGIIALALGIGAATAFVGLAVFIPVLAHASWHLYRRVTVS